MSSSFNRKENRFSLSSKDKRFQRYMDIIMKKEDYNIISIREKKETRNGETIEKEIAVLANGEEELIHLDESGNKYINIHNPFAENKSIAAKYYVRRSQQLGN